MGSINMSQHAAVRKQQRGIPSEALECLIEFGKVCYDHHGAEIIHFDKRSKQRCLSTLSKDRLRKLDGHFDVYAVRGLDGALLTVGHRSRRLPRS